MVSNPDATVIITIDGPAGSGKSTAARFLAGALNARLLETGALYRCVALEASADGIALEDHEALAGIAARLEVRFEPDEGGSSVRVFLRDRDVTLKLRSAELSQGASKVAAVPGVRKALLGVQRRLAHKEGVTVAEGRDLGTVVFPDAAVKFYVVADASVRARRRHLEQAETGDQTPLDAVREDLQKRDARDEKRPVAPMRPADDAVTVDTSRLTREQVLDVMLEEVYRRCRDLRPEEA